MKYAPVPFVQACLKTGKKNLEIEIMLIYQT